MVLHVKQPWVKGGLWPFFKWARFFIYFTILFILYQTFILLKPSPPSSLDNNSTAPPSSQQQQQHKSPDTDNGGIKSFTPLYRDFPWYKSIHPRIIMTANISTTHLTTTERHQWLVAKVDQARTEAKLAFSQLHFTTTTDGAAAAAGGGIPGSVITTHQAAQSFRANIDCLTQGRWIPSTSNQLIRHVQDPLYATCDKRFYKSHASTSPRPETQYEWQPSGGADNTCLRSLPKPSPQQWCRVLNGRHILLVGDLMQYQLHELFLDYLRDGPTVCFGELNCKDHTICADLDSRLRYLRNDVLANNRRHDDHQGTPSGSIVTWPFVASNILKTYPILVLNRSPIAEDDDSFITSLIQTLAYIRRTAPNMLIVYRSSGIGHPYCDDAANHGPLKKPLSDEERKHLPFGWAELERRNAMARAIVEEAGGVFVDLAALTDTRPDGHVGGHDCLRYCIPGPLDTWLDILYQIFATLADGE
ncbi:hypothetical protein BCR42DRAFT_440339 [Absidia repens]|uniref:Uncharacterized protein n=1 Tax=Absidia repens TaxID=90262 RepID=A0A1X2I994_9FUNG|nr:hypothetical protein BCR42DRAFT_440339 [Absidia repens]